MKSLLKGKLGKVLLPLFLVTIFIIVPLVSIGAIWVQHVGLLPNAAVVISIDAAAMDRFMASALKPYYGDRIGICDGEADDVEIQAAIDAALDVKLSAGGFYCETTIFVQNNQNFIGSGRSTGLGSGVENHIFIYMEGVVGVTIADMTILGGDADCGIYIGESMFVAIHDIFIEGMDSETGDYNAAIYVYDSLDVTISDSQLFDNNTGIWLESVEDSITVTGNSLVDNYVGINVLDSGFVTITANTCTYNGAGIVAIVSHDITITGNSCLDNEAGIVVAEGCHDITITGNSCIGNAESNIYVEASSLCTVTGNACNDSPSVGIYLGESECITVTGNSLVGNLRGIYIYNGDENMINGNVCSYNEYDGIRVEHGSDHNTITSNECIGNSQDTTNTYDDIYVEESSCNNIQSNTCRAGALANVPRYAINIATVGCELNLVIDNDLYDEYGTAPFNDDGDDTRLNTYVVPFTDGSDPQDSGFLIDANGEYARAWIIVPEKATQLVRMNIHVRSAVAEADQMRLEIVMYGGYNNESYDSVDLSYSNWGSKTENFAADDIIYWSYEGDISDILAGDSVEIKVLHEAAGNGDCATDAYFRTVEIEYVS